MKNFYKKGAVFAVIILFILIGFSTIIQGNIEINNNLSNSNDDFDKKITELMDHGHFPGLACAIIRNDTLLWSKGYRKAKIGIGPFFEKDVTNDTIFPMASISKSFAATAIMQLNETGRISLDENISRFLPFDLKHPKYPDVNITARMLLSHQASIKNFGLPYSIFCQLIRRPLDWLENHFKKSDSWYDYCPGEYFRYITADINILGYVIENITGMKYADYCKENIFKPLKMNNSSFYLSDLNKEMLVRQYLWFFGFYLRVPFVKVSEIMFPGGGVRSSLNDMSHYLIMHASGGTYDGVRILNESSVKEMHIAQTPVLDENYYYGLGWYFKNFSDGETYGGHSGNHPGAYAIMEMRYSDNVGILIFFNQHSYLLGIFNIRPQKEKDAIVGIKEALFEKADEF